MATLGETRDEVIRIVLAIDREFMDAVATQDAERVAALYTEDARFMMPGWPPIVGRSEILNFFKAALQGVINRVLLDTTEIEVSGDLAFGTGGIRGTMGAGTNRMNQFTVQGYVWACAVFA